jgi:hypothetical protein
VKTLVGAIFRFLGRTANKAADLTTAFLRWVLGLLFHTLSIMGAQALRSGILL